MEEIIKTYFVKIPSGYYYAVARGRYGRFGSRLQAWALCEDCKNKLVKVLAGIADEPEQIPEVEEAGALWCSSCKAKEWKS